MHGLDPSPGMLKMARRKNVYLEELCCYLDDKRLPIDDGQCCVMMVMATVVVEVVVVVVEVVEVLKVARRKNVSLPGRALLLPGRQASAY